jgi:hypothetical protein
MSMGLLSNMWFELAHMSSAQLLVQRRLLVTCLQFVSCVVVGLPVRVVRNSHHDD